MIIACLMITYLFYLLTIFWGGDFCFRPEGRKRLVCSNVCGSLVHRADGVDIGTQLMAMKI